MQSRLLLQGRLFAELAGQSSEIDLNDQIDEVVREIRRGSKSDSQGIILLFSKRNLFSCC